MLIGFVLFVQDSIEKLFPTWQSILLRKEVFLFACGMTDHLDTFLQMLFSRLIFYLKRNLSGKNATDFLYGRRRRFRRDFDFDFDFGLIFLELMQREIQGKIDMNIFLNKFANIMRHNDSAVYVLSIGR